MTELAIASQIVAVETLEPGDEIRLPGLVGWVTVSSVSIVDDLVDVIYFGEEETARENRAQEHGTRVYRRICERGLKPLTVGDVWECRRGQEGHAIGLRAKMLREQSERWARFDR